jgi:hypothetical protein
VPYANIYIQQLQTGTSTDENGYYFITVDPGEYNLVYSALGYESVEIQLFVGDEGVERSIVLGESSVELEEIVVKASKKNPAVEIIQKAAENKKKYLRQLESYRTEVYVKATEEIEQHKKQEIVETVEEDTPLEQQDKLASNQPDVPNINLLEMQVQLNFQQPNRFKEERNAYKVYGTKAGLYVPMLGKMDMNFYRNLVFPRDLTETPVISPISKTAILSYKYKIVASEWEDGVLVHKIKVTPRKVGNSTVEGFVYINEDLWNINRLELSFPKGGLKLYDKFSIEQVYQEVGDSLWLPSRQAYHYETKEGRKRTFKGKTLIQYKQFEPNYVFPDKFFGREVAVTTQEAYERDSSYWKSIRTEPLETEVQRMVTQRDSLEAIYNSPAYKDSIEQVFNKVNLLELAYDGVSFRNHRRQQQWDLGSLASLIDFEVVGGFRINPFASYFKRWDDHRRLFTSASTSIGLKNGDLQGDVGAWYFYDPKRLSSVALDVGRSFRSINPYDAYLNQLSLSNYILQDAVRFRHNMELFNGFYWNVNLGYTDRQSIDRFDGTSFINEIIDETEVLEFQPYKTFISNMYLSYTPAQRYMTEPNRKVVLGSRWPTFTLSHRKGWNGVLGSELDFDYLEFSIAQDVQIGTLGNSKYRAEVGKFFNKENLPFIDLKRFRESDPILYSNPLHSFQMLDTSLAISSAFLEVHHIHHFNGALVNNIPLVKKLKIRAVAGGGLLYVPNDKFRYEEAFAGIERIFKLGARRRLRLGVYGVAANSNTDQFDTSFKVSVDVIDTWRRNWDF